MSEPTSQGQTTQGQTTQGGGPAGHEIVHGTCVAVGPRAALIIGKSGVGKSALALELMALGADLIADDRTVVSLDHGRVVASAPDTIRGQIEARGIGVLSVRAAPPTRLDVVIDLAQQEDARLPERRFYSLMGQNIPLLYRGQGRSFAAALMVYLQSERID